MAGSRSPMLLNLLERVLPWHQGFRLGVNLYPPFLGAGVVVTEVSPDASRVVVELREHRWNRNYVGTHFGGSLGTMADPFYMLMLLKRLGPGFIVLDKAASIRFKRPGKGTVRAVFVVDDARVASIRERLDAGVRSLDEVFEVQITDASGAVVAEVEKVVYVRRKPPRDDAATTPAPGASGPAPR